VAVPPVRWGWSGVLLRAQINYPPGAWLGGISWPIGGLSAAGMGPRLLLAGAGAILRGLCTWRRSPQGAWWRSPQGALEALAGSPRAPGAGALREPWSPGRESSGSPLGALGHWCRSSQGALEPWQEALGEPPGSPRALVQELSGSPYRPSAGALGESWGAWQGALGFWCRSLSREP
jgi:hypothetical protein